MIYRAFSLLLCTAGLLYARPEQLVFHGTGANTAHLEEKLAPFREKNPEANIRFIPLATACKSMQDARHAALALQAGVQEIPCLALQDEQGTIACLPLLSLSTANLEQALQQAQQAERPARERARRYRAERYLLFARMAFANPPEGTELEQCLQSCKELMQHPEATPQERQLLGFRCLYPLLLRQYTAGYQGAHTPGTEAKLLEAIAALEAARDIDPASPIGREAFAERERLRAARRQARRYE